VGILLAAALAGASASAAAQAPTFRHEISLFGSWDDVDEPEQAETLNLNLRYGYFVSPRLLGTATLARSTFEGGGIDTKSTTLLSARSTTSASCARSRWCRSPMRASASPASTTGAATAPT
jgi:hypothetical protein